MMKRVDRLLLYVLALLVWGCVGNNRDHLQRESVVPKPAVVNTGAGKFVFSPKTCWLVENQEQEQVVEQLTALFQQAAGFGMEICYEGNIERHDAIFKTDSSLATEAYHLSVRPDSIIVEAGGTPGFFYAVQTLRQMLPPQIEASAGQENIEWSVPAVEIEDAPRFGYRGFMLDVSRYFMPKENVLKLIDYMGMLKINKLHLHLVDDNGWRLEIRKYPKLTEVGAWRVAREEEFPARKGPEAGELTPVGGFYTQEDIREIVHYAAARSIEVIPEIEMPAHTTSSIAAYPELACDAEGKFVGVLPGFGGYAPVYCAGNEKVFEFLEDVIDEVVELFPSQYIHIGGDEATKVYWKKCPKCQARMKAEKLPNEEELQGYFMQRVNQYVRSKGKTIIGWDELTNSTLPEESVILGWQGMGNAALKAGRQGHPFILAPARVMYLIRYQGPQWFEPRTYFGNNTLSDVFHYEPLDQIKEPELADRLQGLEACLWCEFVSSPQEAEYLIFPRLTAFAERAWCGTEQRDWTGYLRRLDYLLEHYDYLGVNYARSMFNLDHKVTPENEALAVRLSCIRPDVEIRYTLDGGEPSRNASLFKDTLRVKQNTQVKAAAFKDGKQAGKTLVLDLKYNKATAKKIKGNNPGLPLLVNGLKGSDKQSDFEWCGWYGEDGEFVVDLGNSETVDQVSLGVIRNYGMGVHWPETVVLSLSDEGVEYTEIARKSVPLDEIFVPGIATDELKFSDLKATGRYLKVYFRNPGVCPEGHPRAGQNTWVYFDEIEMN